MFKKITLRKLVVFVGLLVFGISAIAIPSRSTYGAQVSVDEPQYLLTALSIGEDLDLDISDEIEEEKFRKFHEIGLNTQTIDMNSSGQRLSPHDPLLPLLLSGPMRIGGWVGARVMLAIFSGLLASATLWVAVRRFKASPKIAAWVIGSFGAAPPLCSYGSQIYPEVPAALAVVLAIATATGTRSRWNSIGFVLAITALPWLSIKYLPVAFTIFLLASLTKDGTGKKFLSKSSAMVFVLMAVVYLLFHQLVYQGWTVYSAGDHFVGGEFEVIGGDPDIWGRSNRIIGLLVDKGFGLAAWTPSFLILPIAIAFNCRKKVDGWHYLILPFLIGWSTATWIAFTMHGWWWPGRQTVAVLPLGIIAITMLLDHFKKFLLPTILATAIGSIGWIWVAIEAQTGRRALIVDFEDTSWPWYKVWSKIFPDFHRMPTNTMWIAAFWALILSLLVTVGWCSVDRNKNSFRCKRADTNMATTDLDGSGSIR
ncbi:MAG: hypothetical protein QGF73_08040 [Acidimicrobiales bacterium]|nr:hypothetical protein [Acidimicrobiales bacterium]